jgi:nucleotide-binding universal stress UspA family protein
MVLRWLDDQVERIEAQGGSVTQAYLRLGRPDEGAITVAEQIVNLAEEIRAGLIVVGSRGQGGIKEPSWEASPTRLSATPTALFWWCAKRSNR